MGEKTKSDEQLSKITFEAPATLKKAFKAKIVQDDLSIKEALCFLMQAYVKGKILIEAG